MTREGGMTRAILASVAACAWKGIPLLLGLLWKPLRFMAPKEKRELYDDGFGWRSPDPAMVDAWDRWETPGEDKHDATNLLVEWFRLNSQRAAKSACALIVAAFIVGLLVGCLAVLVVNLLLAL